MLGQKPDFKANFRMEAKEVVILGVDTCFNTLDKSQREPDKEVGGCFKMYVSLLFQ